MVTIRYLQLSAVLLLSGLVVLGCESSEAPASGGGDGADSPELVADAGDLNGDAPLTTSVPETTSADAQGAEPPNGTPDPGPDPAPGPGGGAGGGRRSDGRVGKRREVGRGEEELRRGK